MGKLSILTTFYKICLAADPSKRGSDRDSVDDAKTELQYLVTILPGLLANNVSLHQQDQIDDICYESVKCVPGK